MKARRATPRRREAPRWSPEEWGEANLPLSLRWAGRCPVCGKPLAEPVERHHRKRRRDGGDSYPQILMLHRACHQWVTEHPADAGMRGLIVATWDDPEKVPVVHADGRKYLLDALGLAQVYRPV